MQAHVLHEARITRNLFLGELPILDDTSCQRSVIHHIDASVVNRPHRREVKRELEVSNAFAGDDPRVKTFEREED